MEIVFLGTGTSQGVPMIAHPEGGCDLSNRKNWRSRCSVHVEMGGHHIQVDAAPEFRLQGIDNDIRKIDTFILTHSHADHIMGMDDLRRFCDPINGVALPVFSSADGIKRIKEVFPYAIQDKAKIRGYPAFSPREMPTRLNLPGGYIDSLYLPHGTMEVLGLIFTEVSTGKKLAYFTDCKLVGLPAREMAKGANLVVLDGLRPEPHPTHMSLSEAVTTASEMKNKMTYITHMTYKVDHDRTESKLPKNVRLAYDGLRITL